MTQGASGRDGLLVLDKPVGWTSHDVVAVVRGVAGTRRVGHAGTLDPLATGVLVLGVGRGTRLLTFLVGCDKSYDATVRLGESTLTDDAEGEVVEVADASAVTSAQIRSAVKDLTGPIEQVPSAVSAIKIGGIRSYARVRAGEQVELSPRRVTVSRFEVLAQRQVPVVDDAGPRTCLDLDISVDVSSGTYVRALARDLGQRLGVGGHLTALRRTRVGRFLLDDATGVERLRAEAPGMPLISLEAAARASLPVRELTEAEALAVGHGQRIPSRPGGAFRLLDEHPPGETDLPGVVVAAFAPDGRLVAVLDQSTQIARPKAVFAPS